MEYLPVDPDSLYQICLELDYPDLAQFVLSNKQVLGICQGLLPYKREVWRLLLHTGDPTNEYNLYVYLNTPTPIPERQAVVEQTLRRHFAVAFTLEQLKEHYLRFWERARATLQRFGLDPRVYLLDFESAWRLAETVLKWDFDGTFVRWGDTYYVRKYTRSYTDRDYWTLMLLLSTTALSPRFQEDLRSAIIEARSQEEGYIEDVLQGEADEIWRGLFEPYRFHDEAAAESLMEQSVGDY